jgi:competence protein ComEC
MNLLELIVFNVGHGLSVALIEKPENYVSLIDLGCSDDFSPVNFLLRSLKLYPDILYITHPHGDHISDVVSIISSRQQPSYIDVQDYDWRDVEQREKYELREILRTYVRYINQANRGSYAGNARLRYWRYTPDEAKQLYGESTYINNSSLFLVYTWQSFKIAIPGDLHSNAMDDFISHSEFSEEAKSTDLLIAPHHGHKEGYTSLWPKRIGKPYLTLISVQESDPHIAQGYSSPDFAQGVPINGQRRYMLTTRQDGHIKVQMYYDQDNKPVWNFTSF